MKQSVWEGDRENEKNERGKVCEEIEREQNLKFLSKRKVRNLKKIYDK